MFKLVEVESWVSANHLPAISFVCLFVVFVGATIKALLAAKGKTEKMAALPLDDGELKNSSDN